MLSVELEEAKERLAELIEQAAQGEEVVITRNGEPMARIVPFQWQEDLLDERLANSADEKGRDWEDVRAELWPLAK
jgi:prevent-host-death family protein